MTNDAAGWTQYDPFRKPEDCEPEAEKAEEVSAATMFMTAKKLMAREWRRARGITKPDPDAVAFEKEASEWEEKQRQAEQRERERLAEGDRQKARVGEYLGRFVDAVLATPKPRRPKSLEDTARLLKEAFEDFGEVFDVEWPDEGGCEIWLEPWATRRARRAAGQTRPSLHRVVLGTKLDVISYELVTDEKLQQRKRQDLLVKPLRFSAEELEKLREARNLPEVLAQRMQDVGRMLDVRRTNNGTGGWHIYVQPWDQIRDCRLNHRPSTAIQTYGISLGDDLRVRFIQLLPSKVKKNGSKEREENTRFL